ncbi:MAG: GGDEF domain-containing protein [Gemmatimonadaceae bacterium]|jgi:diguanylate cyclase (GGDEF)-like protein|nr:GGDEF domain-containing protein [Gemmatimonadaceae bacterium]
MPSPPTPQSVIRVSQRLTPLAGIAAVDADGSVQGDVERRQSAWRSFWVVDDPVLRDAGLRAERDIARVRLILAALLVLIPINALVDASGRLENWIGFTIAIASVVVGAAVLLLTRGEYVPRWVGFVASMLDVTWVSIALVLYAVAGRPEIAVNSRVVFEVYFLCIAITCVRYDRRITLVTGLLAVVQYGIVIWVARRLAGDRWNPVEYGTFSAPDQAARLALLLIATAVSLLIVKRIQQLRVLSVRDRLTGLVIRGYFDERLGEEYKRARREGEPLAVAMIDLDYFKSFNDRFGHAVGDLVLAAVARAVRQLVRAEDVVGRYGGEELIVMLPGLDKQRALERMEQIRRAVSRVRVEHDTTPLPVAGSAAAVAAAPVLTASIGIASWPEDACETVEALVYRADARLLTAKSTGRNRVIADLLPTTGPGPVTGLAS